MNLSTMIFLRMIDNIKIDAEENLSLRDLDDEQRSYEQGRLAVVRQIEQFMTTGGHIKKEDSK